MVNFEILNRRIEIVKLSLDKLNDIIQLESDKLLINWLKLIKKDLKELETLI